MARKCQLSRSRFYDLVEEGVFPKPLYTAENRPYYDAAKQEQCLQVLRSGEGINGKPTIFYRKTK